MTISSFHLSLALAFAATAATPAFAQSYTVQPVSDADTLASVMRRVASNPQDAVALTTAGELSLKVGDTAAAAAMFARADKINPRSPRVKAGMATLLVRSERPGEALRYFAQAESYGLDPRLMAAERGLAYDLIGQQERAQRDYWLALRNGQDDETVRRYALSLGISGKREAALEQLDPLVRKGDRAAWRCRAFVLAMAGDGAGASKIATTMMPAGMAAGLAGFFRQLPLMPAIDRAFAVHFGATRATPARLADARLAPAMPPLAREAGAPVMLAARPASVPVVVEEGRGSRRDRRAAPSAAPARVARSSPPVATARATPALAVPSRSVGGPASPVVASAPAPEGNRQIGTATRLAVDAAPSRATPRAPAATDSVRVAALSPAQVSRPALSNVGAPARVATAPPPAAAIVNRAAPPAADSILARIVANIPVPTPVAPIVAAKPAALATVKAVEPPAAPKPSAAERRAAERKALADRKGAAAKKAAADKKALVAKEAVAARKAARANAPRIWVQVAGGASEGDLPKAWAKAKAKAPALAGREGWTTPLRATNRVLTGPFKTEAEARAVVNQLARQGVSAFSFVSAAGQKVTRLTAK